MPYKITLSTIASITVEVDAETEDEAIDAAYEQAHKFGNQYHAGHNWIVDVNNEWQFEEPTVEEIAEVR